MVNEIMLLGYTSCQQKEKKKEEVGEEFKLYAPLENLNYLKTESFNIRRNIKAVKFLATSAT